MMTSRSEYRLLLRQDNADRRLSAYGLRVGLISQERYDRVIRKYEMVDAEIARIERTTIPPSETLAEILRERGSTPVETGIRLGALLRRPELDYQALTPVDTERPQLPRAVREAAEISIRYEGYLKRQESAVAQFRKLEGKLLPEDFDYNLPGLRLEARQKLGQRRPRSLGQAARISGVSPADITVLMIALGLH